MSTRPARSSRMSTKAPTPVALGTGVSVMLTKIRTKIRQTANQFRRTKRRTSTSDSLTHSVVSIPVELTLPYSRPTMSQSSLISQDMVAEEDAWWIRDRQSHPPFVPGVPSWATPLPSPLDLDDPTFTLPCWPIEQVVECSSFDGEEMDTTSYSSSSRTTSFSVPPSQSTLSESIHSVEGSTLPSAFAVSPRRGYHADSRPHNDDNANPTDVAMGDANDSEHEIRHDNDALPYYGTTLIPLPTTPIPTPAPKTKCEGVKRSSKQLPASTSLAYSFHGPNLCVTISAPAPSDSAYHSLAIDEIFSEMASKPDLASIDVAVPAGCDDLPYAAKLVNDVFSVLQGCSVAPTSISVCLPVTDGVESYTTPPCFPLITTKEKSHLQPQRIVNEAYGTQEDLIPVAHLTSGFWSKIPGLSPWWHLGRMSLSQLSSLVISYPLPLDDFLGIMNSAKHIESVKATSLMNPRIPESPTHLRTSPLPNVTALTLASEGDLKPFFDSFEMPYLRDIRLVVKDHASPDLYDLWWDSLDEIYVQCPMTDAGERRLREYCDEGVRVRRLYKIINTRLTVEKV